MKTRDERHAVPADPPGPRIVFRTGEAWAGPDQDGRLTTTCDAEVVCNRTVDVLEVQSGDPRLSVAPNDGGWGFCAKFEGKTRVNFRLRFVPDSQAPGPHSLALSAAAWSRHNPRDKVMGELELQELQLPVIETPTEASALKPEAPCFGVDWDRALLQFSGVPQEGLSDPQKVRVTRRPGTPTVRVRAQSRFSWLEVRPQELELSDRVPTGDLEVRVDGLEFGERQHFSQHAHRDGEDPDISLVVVLDSGQERAQGGIVCSVALESDDARRARAMRAHAAATWLAAGSCLAYLAALVLRWGVTLPAVLLPTAAVLMLIVGVEYRTRSQYAPALGVIGAVAATAIGAIAGTLAEGFLHALLASLGVAVVWFLGRHLFGRRPSQTWMIAGLPVVVGACAAVLLVLLGTPEVASGDRQDDGTGAERTESLRPDLERARQLAQTNSTGAAAAAYAAVIREAEGTAGAAAVASDAYRDLEGLLSGLRVAVESGQNQVGTARGGLPAPLVIKVTTGPNASPAQDIPLVFRSDRSTVELVTDSLTGEDGRAQCRISRILFGGDEFVTTAQVDVPRLLGFSSGDAQVPARLMRIATAAGAARAVFTSKVAKSAGEARFLVVVVERVSGEASAESIVATRLQESLLVAGYGVVGDTEVGKSPAQRLRQAVDANELLPIRDELLGLAEAVVWGAADVESARQLKSGLFEARAGGTVKAVDLVSGDLLAQATVSGTRGVDASAGGAQQAALHEAAKQLAEDLVRKIGRWRP